MSSRVDAAEVLAMQADLAATPKFSSRNILADLSAVTDFQVTSKTFAEYTRRVTDSERAAPISKTRRVALVSPTKIPLAYPECLSLILTTSLVSIVFFTILRLLSRGSPKNRIDRWVLLRQHGLGLIAFKTLSCV